MGKKDFAAFFKDKTVTLLGLGLLGRGVGDAAFLARHCRKVFVTDAKDAEALKPSLETLKDFSNIEFFLGGNAGAPFTGVDFVIKGAGVRLDHPSILLAQAHGVPVYMSTALFASLSPLKVIGVTGTRGKTTTTCMIAEILKHAGKKVLLGGNIRGVSTLGLLPEADKYDIAVLELDSWQLQGFDTLKISPNISVFTTFLPDHMNYYDGDMDRYRVDKTAIFRHQKSGDSLVTTEIVAKVIEKEREGHLGKMVVTGPLPDGFALKMPGAHHLLNAGLAKAVGKICGLEETLIDEALRDFAGVEGRMQRVGEWQGRVIYNDNNATTQDATLAALKSFPPEKIVLLFGGADKGLPIEALVEHIRTNKIRCVVFQGTGSDRVLKILPDLPIARSMKEAVRTATDLSKAGDVILLSPAFASFGLFRNEYDKNDQFMAEIAGLIADAARTSGVGESVSRRTVESPPPCGEG